MFFFLLGGRLRDNDEMIEFACRVVRAVGRRLEQDDPETLLRLREIQTDLDEVWASAVAGMRSSGWTDGSIGEVLGVTKQAVSKRWPRTAA